MYFWNREGADNMLRNSLGIDWEAKNIIDNIIKQEAQNRGMETTNVGVICPDDIEWIIFDINGIPLLPIGDWFYIPVDNPWFEQEMRQDWESYIWEHDETLAMERLGITEEDFDEPKTVTEDKLEVNKGKLSIIRETKTVTGINDKMTRSLDEAMNKIIQERYEYWKDGGHENVNNAGRRLVLNHEI